MLCGGITVVSVCVVWWLQRRRRRCVEIPLRVQWLRTGNAAAASTRHLPIWASALVLFLHVVPLLVVVVRFETFSLLTFLAVCVSFHFVACARFPFPCRTCWILLSHTAHDADAASQPRAFQRVCD